jgi:hypothetical protein
VCDTGEFLPHAEAVDRWPASKHGRLLERAYRLALVGNSWRNDLVSRCSPKLCCFTRTRHRSGNFVRDWTGSNNGFRHLGSFYLEGICQCTSERKKTSTTGAHLFRRRVGRIRSGPSIPEVTTARPLRLVGVNGEGKNRSWASLWRSRS